MSWGPYRKKTAYLILYNDLSSAGRQFKGVKLKLCTNSYQVISITCRRYVIFFLIHAKKNNAEDHVYQLFENLFDAEKGYFEANIDALTPRQKSLMKTLAKERTQNIYSNDYIKKHNLGSIGGIQQSVDTLSKNDLITKENTTWKVVDPVMEVWLRERFFVF